MLAKLVGFRSVTPVTLDGQPICFVRSLTVTELRNMDAAAESIGKEDDERNLKAVRLMIAASACDEAGKPIFDGPEDPSFNEIQMAVLGRVFEAAAEVNNKPGKA